jgi:hypothetical protein
MDQVVPSNQNSTSMTNRAVRNTVTGGCPKLPVVAASGAASRRR